MRIDFLSSVCALPCSELLIKPIDGSRELADWVVELAISAVVAGAGLVAGLAAFSGGVGGSTTDHSSSARNVAKNTLA